jgi:hypothetical protein
VGGEKIVKTVLNKPKNCKDCRFMLKYDYVETSPVTKIFGIRRAWVYMCEKAQAYVARDDLKFRPKECPLE